MWCLHVPQWQMPLVTTTAPKLKCLIQRCNPHKGLKAVQDLLKQTAAEENTSLCWRENIFKSAATGKANMVQGKKSRPITPLLSYCSHFSLSLKPHCNTPVLTPFALNIHDTYIVNNHGEELKAKAPPSIWLCYVSDLELSLMVYWDMRHTY